MVEWNGGLEWNKRMKRNGETESPAVHVFSLLVSARRLLLLTRWISLTFI